LINNKLRFKETEVVEKKRTNEDRLRELDRLNQMNMEEKEYKDYKQRIYKGLLDNQTKVKSPVQSPVQGRNNFTKSEEFINNYNNPNLNNSYVFTKKADIVPNPCIYFFNYIR
jgi:hypothetical protein